jgi:rfaE bifunctional protein kinase chain/domain
VKSLLGGTYRRKIKSVDQLCEIIGPRPRRLKVIMCHGTFDVVHPGHIRHLIYARSKADLLVASLTSDAHIEKAQFRPYVPEELRAMNLAALEVVDYVIVDQSPTPLENLRRIQPDYFAKGYEYINGTVHPKTRAEMEALESYGGEMLFTPGDVVYSSSKLIDGTPPDISTEKLLTLMEAEELTFSDLRATLGKFSGLRAHVVGDTIVDTYTYCTLIGSNAKTPTFSVRYENRVDFVGGAAVVAKHLRAAGAEVRLSTVLGDDDRKDFVLDDLRAAGVECEPVIDPTRPTTNKNAFIAGGYRLLKVDTLDNRGISDRIVSTLGEGIRESRTDALILSDFRHGIFHRGSIPSLLNCIPRGVYRVADSQVASRWGNILDFAGVDLITPNEKEARFALGDQDSVVRPLALKLYREARCKTLILKLGPRGILVYRKRPTDDVRAFFVVDSFADNVLDPMGAGDALLAYSTLSMLGSGTEVISGILGSCAAAVECERDGNLPIAPTDVIDKVARLEERANFC